MVDSKVMKDINSIIKKLIFTGLCCSVLYFLVINRLPVNIPPLNDFPVRSVNIAKTNNDLAQKIREIKAMNQQIAEIQQKEPELRKNAENVPEHSVFILNQKKDKVVDIPSILVYLEQVGKKTGAAVDKIDVQGAENSSDSNGKQTAKASGPADSEGQELVVTGTSTYQGFINYLREIQINTKESITVKDYNLSYADPVTSLWKFELKISL